MFFIEKIKLNRKENRFLSKLNKSEIFKSLKIFLWFFISWNKSFLLLFLKWIKKVVWSISIFTFSFFWILFSYIDDFLIHKEKQWKWLWKKIFQETLDVCKKKKTDFVILVSDKKRKRSHLLYKKFWFTLLSFGLFVFAYKKINKNK